MSHQSGTDSVRGQLCVLIVHVIAPTYVPSDPRSLTDVPIVYERVCVCVCARLHACVRMFWVLGEYPINPFSDALTF